MTVFTQEPAQESSPGVQTKPPRRSLSRRVKAFMEPRLIAARRYLSPRRALPDFIIIGARKCGTSFLYNNLVRQKGFLPAYKKEVRFFDKHYPRGAEWYRAHFPTEAALRAVGAVTGGPALTGESSPLYLFDPRAPERVRALLPEARLIVLLRNPVERAYSQYQHHARRGRGAPTFEQALEWEQELAHSRMPEELRRMMREEGYVSELRQLYSCLSAGIYADQLEAWFARFPARQMFVLKAEEMYRDPEKALRRVLAFLGGGEGGARIVRENPKPGYPRMNSDTRRWLERYFEPQNRRLYEFLGGRGYEFSPWED
jgi:hypothetical protein